MRTPKFKAWVKPYYKHKWQIMDVEYPLCICDGELYEVTYDGIQEYHGKYILIQYIGLKDKNNVKIYSGYRLKCEDLYVTVKWDDDKAGFIFEDDDGRDIIFYTKDYVCEHFEIIDKK